MRSEILLCKKCGRLVVFCSILLLTGCLIYFAGDNYWMQLISVLIVGYLLYSNFVGRHELKVKMEESSRREKDLIEQHHRLEGEIKDRKLAESMRKRAEVRYHDVFDNASVGIFQVSISGDFISANNSFAEIFGYSDADAMLESQLNIVEKIHAENAGWGTVVERLKADGRIKNLECRLSRGRSPVWVRMDMRIALNPDGKEYIEGFAYVIDQRKKAEQQLADSEKRFRSLFNNSPVSLWEYDGSEMKAELDRINSGHEFCLDDYFKSRPSEVKRLIELLTVLNINKTTFSLFYSASKEELCSLGIGRFVNDSSIDFFRNLLLSIASGEKFMSGEICYDSRSGDARILAVRCSVVTENENRIFKILASVEDITETRKLESELREAKNTAQKANEIKGQFLANMSHEFRTPMNAIIGLAEIVDTDDLEDEQREKLGLIKSSARSLLVLINDILDLSKVDSGYMHLQPEFIDFSLFINDLMELAAVQAGKLDVKLDLRIEDIKGSIKVDSIRLRQILLNLLSNAVKFAPGGEVVLNARSCGPVSEKGTVDLCFEVIDNGIGLPEDRIDNLFNPFDQGGCDVFRHFGGTGLGLSITHKLVSLMGGEIEAFNNDQGGATFVVKLSVEFCDTKKDCQANHDSAHCFDGTEVDGLSSLKILIAEDCRVNSMVLKKLLVKLGAEDIKIVDNGMKAVESVLADHFDVVFMDMQMPEMDGLSATRKIRESNKDIKIVALTGNAQAESCRTCCEAGMNSVLTKPIDINDLINGIKEVSSQR